MADRVVLGLPAGSEMAISGGVTPKNERNEQMTLQEARDLAIILLAVESAIVTLLLGVVAIMLWRLIRMIHQEIKPVLTSLRETASTVQGTTSFVSDVFVSPLIKTSSVLAGVGGALRHLIARKRT